jgi:predicted nucleic acid-binding protein
MIVVDASAIAHMLIYGDDRGRKARAVLGRDTQWAAPEHWKAEVFSVIRGLAVSGKIREEKALHALARLPRLGIDHVSLDGLLRRMWDLRAHIAANDAPYVALAEARDATLVTSDGRLARAATSYCRVELVA